MPVKDSQAMKYHALIFDLGKVFFDWNPSIRTAIDPSVLRRMFASNTWGKYECGLLSQADCYLDIALKYDFDVEQVAAAIEGARMSIQCNQAFVGLIHELKPGRRIFAMSNMSCADWEHVQQLPFPWEIFERVFISAEAHERKPNQGFYRYVLEQTCIEPSETIFIDDTLENVIASRTFGMTALHFEKSRQKTIFEMLRNMCRDSVISGEAYLERNAGHHVSVTSAGNFIPERFSQLLILEITGDRSLVDCSHCSSFVGFMSDGTSTADVDTTSITLTIIGDEFDRETKDRVMDAIVSLCNSDGVVQVYFDEDRPRVDPVVCINALTMFYKYGRGAELAATLRWIEAVLATGAYQDGTRYYPTAESFLFFLSRLLPFLSNNERRRVLPAFKEGVVKCIGADGDALSLAMRILAAAYVGIRDVRAVERLRFMQEEDGGWPAGCAYRYGLQAISVGNRGLTTALAVKAIQVDVGGWCGLVAVARINTIRCARSSSSMQCERP